MKTRYWILIGLACVFLIGIAYYYSPVKIEVFNTEQEKDRDALIKELAQVKENEQKNIREAEERVRESLIDSFNIATQDLIASKNYYYRLYAGLKNQHIDTVTTHMHGWYADFEIPESK